MKKTTNNLPKSAEDWLVTLVFICNISVLIFEASRNTEHAYLGIVATAIILAVLVARQKR